MFGTNPIRSVIHNPLVLSVENAFFTLQGEGPYAGMPALFIRLSGCNLACYFCDTQFETGEGRAVEHVMADILAKFTPEQRRFVVLTGGEPLRQNWSRLAKQLLANGTRLIQVETAGTCWQEDLEPLMKSIRLVCSPKTPKLHPRIAQLCQDWKYVIKAGEQGEDGLPMYGTQNATKGKVQFLYRPHPSGPATDTIWCSPMDEYNEERNKLNMEAARDACLKHGYRLTLQMHKIVGVE